MNSDSLKTMADVLPFTAMQGVAHSPPWLRVLVVIPFSRSVENRSGCDQ
jgi:hypothetical protein